MPGSSVQRTIVKSQPEIWSEVSDETSLARHFDGFGEITIAGLTPETAVAWEGDRVRGTVTLERSGWGTKVTVTAETQVDEARSGSSDGPAQQDSEVTEPEFSHAVDDPGPPTVEKLQPPESLPTVDAVQAPTPKPRWWQRFRRRGVALPTDAGTDTGPQTSPIGTSEPEPKPEATPMVVLDVEPEVVAAIEPAPDYDLETILGAMLDHLSAAHHRPFSRG